MRVLYRQSNNRDFVLVAGVAETALMEDLKINHQRVVQVGEFLRALTAQPFARGNRKTTMSWSITREHADFRAAEQFLLSHSAEIPASGTLMLIAEGSGQKTYKLSNAELQTHESKRIGVTTLHTYTFIGGDFSEGTS